MHRAIRHCGGHLDKAPAQESFAALCPAFHGQNKSLSAITEMAERSTSGALPDKDSLLLTGFVWPEYRTRLRSDVLWEPSFESQRQLIDLIQ